MSEETKNAATPVEPGPEEAPAPRLKKLTIHRFRGVRPTSLVFDDEWNVLLGKNGTGKTTLLELIAATLRGDLRAFADVDYELEAELSFGPANVKWIVENKEVGGISEQVSANLPSGIVRSRVAQRRFRAEVSGDGLQSYTLTGDERGFDQHPGMTATSVAGGSAPFLLLLAHGVIDQLVTATAPVKRAVNAAARSGDVQRFDEILTFFQRICPDGDLTVSQEDPQEILGSEELTKVVRTRVRPTDERITISHEELPFLRRFVDLCGLSGASLHLELIRREARGEKSIAWFGRPSFLLRRPNGEEIREQHLSFGQKRLLAFLYYLTISNPVVADELVDGLHFDWISACVDAARGRQKFFASQSPLLVDHMGFKTREAVRARFIRCTLEGSEMVWSNFSTEEADDFFVAYRTGIQAVSEILRQKGLW